MRTLMFATAALGALAIAGCTTTDLAQVESEAQTIAATTCGFVPTADTIANIVIPLASAATGAGSPQTIADAADSVARAICAPILAKGAHYGARHVLIVRGVAIHGTFVRDGRVI